MLPLGSPPQIAMSDPGTATFSNPMLSTEPDIPVDLWHTEEFDPAGTITPFSVPHEGINDALPAQNNICFRLNSTTPDDRIPVSQAYLLTFPLIEVGNAVTTYCYSIASYP